jgi:hypothetical protein
MIAQYVWRECRQLDHRPSIARDQACVYGRTLGKKGAQIIRYAARSDEQDVPVAQGGQCCTEGDMPLGTSTAAD